MYYPKTDNDCEALGWEEFIVYIGDYDLHVSIEPDTDLDGIFKAFCHDEQEMVSITGWNVSEFQIIE